MKKLKGMVILFFLLFVLWVLLTSADKQELITGGILAFLITLLFGKFASYFEAVKLTPKALLFFPYYLFVFVVEMVKSNFDVAFRVLNPALPIAPGIVKIKTRLKSDLGKLILANSITLTPGTLTVDVKGNSLFIHWIDVKTAESAEATKIIASRFEKILSEIFE